MNIAVVDVSVLFQVDKRYSMPVSPSVPPGWSEERDNKGDVYYVNDVSTEKVSHSANKLHTGRWFCVFKLFQFHCLGYLGL